MGNPVFEGFNNFYQTIHGSYLPPFNDYETVVELDNTSDNQSPVVKIEYIAWILMDKKTNNYEITEKIGRMETEAEWRIRTGGKAPRTNIVIPAHKDQQTKYFEDNPNKYVEAIKEVSKNQRIVDKKLRQITLLKKQLEPIYRTYENYNQTIEIIDEQINDIEIKLNKYQSFMTDGNSRQMQPLSLYADTSDFDDTLEVDMGRAEPMRLTTKVAQQWYGMFSGIAMRGVNDVCNYGPAKGGTCYFPPSNIKKFRLSQNKVGKPAIGIPKIVLDPAAFAQMSLVKQYQHRDLSKDANTTPENQPRKYIKLGLFWITK